MKACSTCAYGVTIYGFAPLFQSMVECRFHAPEPVVGPIIAPADRMAHPAVLAPDYWCGKWEHRQAEKLIPEKIDLPEKPPKVIHGPYFDDQPPHAHLTPLEQVITYDSQADLEQHF